MSEQPESMVGHNSEAGKVVWERWTKKRTFVRALEGTYGELKEELYRQPRIYKTSDLKWKGGPRHFGKKVINPQANRIAQSIESHVEVFAPHGAVLKGKGHDVHDGRRIDWEAGDALVVENACVHQHLNDSDDESLVLVLKAKPLFLFMHMIFQKVVEFPPETPVPGYETYAPPASI